MGRPGRYSVRKAVVEVPRTPDGPPEPWKKMEIHIQEGLRFHGDLSSAAAREKCHFHEDFYKPLLPLTAARWGLWGEELWLSSEVSVLGVEYQGIVDTERRAWARRDGHWY